MSSVQNMPKLNKSREAPKQGMLNSTNPNCYKIPIYKTTIYSAQTLQMRTDIGHQQTYCGQNL